MKFTRLPVSDNEDNTPETNASNISTVSRNIGRSIARVGERIAGFPGNLATGALDVADYVGETAGNLLGSERLKKKNLEGLRKYIPTSETANKYITKPIESGIGEGSLTPQSKNEERSDELISDITDFVLGGPKKGLGLLRNVAIPIAANAAKWLTEKVTGSEAAGSGVKLGTMLVGSFAGGRAQLQEKASKNYDKSLSKSNLKKPVNVKRTLQKSAKEVMEGLEGFESPSKNLVKKTAGEILNSTAGNNTSTIGELVDADQVLSELFRTGEKELSANPKSKRLLTLLKKGVTDAIDTTKNKYPRFYKPYVEAKDIWQGLYRTEAIREGLEHVATGQHFKSPLTAYLIFKNPSKLGFQTALWAGANIAKSPYDFISGFLRSPSIRRHYGNMMKTAATGKFTAALKEAHKLDDALSEEFSEGEESGFSRVS